VFFNHAEKRRLILFLF